MNAIRFAIVALLSLGISATAVGQRARISFIAVAADVKLEVIDWGGTGRPVILLAGNGQTAHSFDEFAPSLAQSYHVYGITRRGFGESSKPLTGYRADQLANDVLAVLDSLHITRAVFAGHSLAGQELSSIGNRFPQRVHGLVYLDAAYAYAIADTTRGDFSVDIGEFNQRLADLQTAGNHGMAARADSLLGILTDSVLPRLQRDFTKMRAGTRQLPAAVPYSFMPPPLTGIARSVDEGRQRYRAPKVPMLAIFAVRNPPNGVGVDTAVTRKWLAQNTEAPGLFSRVAPQSRLVLLPNANHFVFQSNAAEVLGEMLAFISGLPL